jgi:selenocysteine lyase/cysteine desulfurase
MEKLPLHTSALTDTASRAAGSTASLFLRDSTTMTQQKQQKQRKSPYRRRLPLLAFNARDVHASDLCASMAADNICVSAGAHCAQPLHQLLHARYSTICESSGSTAHMPVIVRQMQSEQEAMPENSSSHMQLVRGSLRVSPYLYNSYQDIDKFVDCLKRTLNSYR